MRRGLCCLSCRGGPDAAGQPGMPPSSGQSGSFTQVAPAAASLHRRLLGGVGGGGTGPKASPRAAAEGAVGEVPALVRRYAAWYCTPHVRVPGSVFITSESVGFRADPRHERVREFGAEQYEVTIELRDILECGAMVAPLEDGPPSTLASKREGVAFFLQLHLRTLDGLRFRTQEEEAAEDPWRVVFRLPSREELYEAAQLVLDALADRPTRLEGESSRTSVPFPCLDCISLVEFEASALLAERLEAAPSASPKKRRSQALLGVLLGGPSTPSSPSAPGTQGSRRGRRKKRGAADTIDEEGLVTPDEPATSTSPRVAQVLLRPCPTPSDRTLLTESLAECILEYLPVHLRLPGAVEWVLRYTPKAHGVSLSTLYRNLADREKTVIVVQDAEAQVFGGFAPAAWEVKSKFYGSGEAFVFTFSGADTDNPQMTLYPWTAMNDYFMYSDNELIAMGGGDGRHALAVRSDLLHGLSHPTPTFGNPILASSEEFVVRDLEVWSLEEIE